MLTLVTASTEYAKDPKLRPTDIAQLREWLKKQPHFPQNITEELLIAVLHSSEYSLEQAKQLLDINITCRTDYEFFSNRDPLTKDKRAVWDIVDFWIDSKRTTKENYRILFAGLKVSDAENFNFPALLNMFVSLIDTVVATEGVCPGYVLVLDCRAVSLAHLAKASLSLIRDILTYIQLNFHTGEMEEFYKSVPKSILPLNIGGTNGNHKDLVASSRNKVEKMSKWLIEQEKLVMDGSKRPNKKNDKFSLAGSFRKLDLD